MSQEAKEGIRIQQFINELLLNEVVREINMLKDNEISLILTWDFKSQNEITDIDVMPTI